MISEMHYNTAYPFREGMLFLNMICILIMLMKHTEKYLSETLVQVHRVYQSAGN